MFRSLRIGRLRIGELVKVFVNRICRLTGNPFFACVSVRLWHEKKTSPPLAINSPHHTVHISRVIKKILSTLIPKNVGILKSQQKSIEERLLFWKGKNEKCGRELQVWVALGKNHVSVNDLWLVPRVPHIWLCRESSCCHSLPPYPNFRRAHFGTCESIRLHVLI